MSTRKIKNWAESGKYEQYRFENRDYSYISRYVPIDSMEIPEIG